MKIRPKMRFYSGELTGGQSSLDVIEAHRVFEDSTFLLLDCHWFDLLVRREFIGIQHSSH